MLRSAAMPPGKKGPITKGFKSWSKVEVVRPSKAAVPVANREMKENFAVAMDWNRWRRVYALLFGGTARGDLIEALAAMSHWEQDAKCRRDPSLFPPYAAATRELVTVLVGADSATVSEDFTRHAYCGAILRAVTELTERNGRAIDSGSSYRGRALSVGLPTEVTEVRNQAAHGRTPNLAQLRWAALVAMRHLKIEYWDAQAPEVDALLDHQAQAATPAEREAKKRLEAVDRAAAASGQRSAAALTLDVLREKMSGLRSAAAASEGSVRAPVDDWT
jgi:hypothetical protein